MISYTPVLVLVLVLCTGPTGLTSIVFLCDRFEVLEQVCSCGQVLGNVVSEVERRQTFNHLFTEVS